MKNYTRTTPFVLLFLLIACSEVDETKEITVENPKVEEIEIKGEQFNNQEVGWTIIIPEGWHVLSTDATNASVENGKEIILKSTQMELNYDGLRQLVNFQKDSYNQFLSSYEPFEVEYEGEWEKNNTIASRFLYETFKNQGIILDSSSTTHKIDDLNFNLFHLTLYSKDNEVIMYEDVYSRLINGYDFSVVLTYNNDEDRKVLETALNHSKFSIKEH